MNRVLLLSCVAVVTAFATMTFADAPKVDAKEVTLEGTMWCAKCGLKVPGITKCTNAI
jgi:hypothetical protein